MQFFIESYSFMQHFERISKSLKGTFVKYEQNDNLGFFRGPSGLCQLAHRLMHEKQTEGYCFALCAFLFENNFVPNTFIRRCKQRKGRGQIRGYQKINEMLPADEDRYKFLGNLFIDKYGLLGMISYSSYSGAANMISYKKELDAVIIIRGEESAHALCCRVNSQGSVLFDPNYGFAIFKEKPSAGKAFEKLMNYVYVDLPAANVMPFKAESALEKLYS